MLIASNKIIYSEGDKHLSDLTAAETHEHTGSATYNETLVADGEVVHAGDLIEFDIDDALHLSTDRYVLKVTGTYSSNYTREGVEFPWENEVDYEEELSSSSSIWFGNNFDEDGGAELTATIQWSGNKPKSIQFKLEQMGHNNTSCKLSSDLEVVLTGYIYPCNIEIKTDSVVMGNDCNVLGDMIVNGEVSASSVQVDELQTGAVVGVTNMTGGEMHIGTTAGSSMSSGSINIGTMSGGSLTVTGMTGGNTTITSMHGGSLSTTLSLSSLKTRANLVLEKPDGSYNNGNVPADDKKWENGHKDPHQYFSIDLSGTTGTGTGYLYLIHCEVMYKSSTTSRHYLYYDSYGVFNGVQGCSGFDNPNISDPAGTLHLMCHKTPSHLYFQMFQCDAEGVPPCNDDDADYTFYSVTNQKHDQRTCFNYIHVYRLPFKITK